jgi:hypothetical protein
MTDAPLRCRCDGRYEGCDHGPNNRRCEEYGPGRWSPYFCDSCDGRRVKHIGESLRSIQADLIARSVGGL